MTVNKNKKILIVEDEPFLVEMYKTRFEQDGYGVYVALNGTPVMDIMKKNKPDLVLLDIVMPEKNGYEVLKDLKGKRSDYCIYIILIWIRKVKLLILTD